MAQAAEAFIMLLLPDFTLHPPYGLSQEEDKEI